MVRLVSIPAKAISLEDAVAAARKTLSVACGSSMGLWQCEMERAGYDEQRSLFVIHLQHRCYRFENLCLTEVFVNAAGQVVGVRKISGGQA